MSGVEVHLDETPGEDRGVLVRDGCPECLIIHRQTDQPRHRLGAVSIGRVARVEDAFRAAFVDLGCEGPMGFLPVSRAATLREGEAIEVEVTAEPREAKGPVLRLVGAGQGAPRLLSEGPSVRQSLAMLAPGMEPTLGPEAIRAGREAEEEALDPVHRFPAQALDLAVERTRAMVVVDIDYGHVPGRDARKGRWRANVEGLNQAARLIGLKGWGGLVAIDLVGTAFDARLLAEQVRAAFGAEAVIGPVSRFGVVQLSLPWRTRPVEERLLDPLGRRTLETRALDILRSLRLEMLTDTASPRVTARCSPEEAEAARSGAARLGPRAVLVSDPAVLPGHPVIEKG
jgi:Ribonuclease G/E